jgi:DNA-binding MarR family transcriptional regulator
MNSIHEYADDRDDLPVFIHSELDDYGLDPYQFRIYTRIARRAGRQGAYESIKNMAEGCCMSEGKAKSSLRFLIEQGLVSRKTREGYTSIYRLNPKSKWLPRKRMTGVDIEQPGSSGVHPPGSSGVHPPGSSGVHEGNPVEGSLIEINPVEGSPCNPPIIPQRFQSEGEREATHAEVEIVNESFQNFLLNIKPKIEITPVQKNLISGISIPARENENQIQKLRPIQQIFEESGRIINYGTDYKDWIQAEMGDVIKQYLRSGRALTASPNDVDSGFKNFTAANANGGKGLKLSSVQGWVVNCEKDPLRWGELRDLVAEWMLAKSTGNCFTSIAKEINRERKQAVTANNLMSMLSDRIPQQNL